MTYKIKIVEQSSPGSTPYETETDLPVPRVGERVSVGGREHEIQGVTYEFYPAGAWVRLSV